MVTPPRPEASNTRVVFVVRLLITYGFAIVRTPFILSAIKSPGFELDTEYGIEKLLAYHPVGGVETEIIGGCRAGDEPLPPELFAFSFPQENKKKMLRSITPQIFNTLFIVAEFRSIEQFANSNIISVGSITNTYYSKFPDIRFLNNLMNERDRKRLKKFASHLTKLRKGKGLSLRELSARCDVDYGKISKLENNKANLTLTTLIELAEGLEVHPKTLLDIDFD